jgi:hypothetical protein
MPIGEHLRGNLADPGARVFARVMLCERGTREFLFYLRYALSFQHESGEMGNAIRRGFVVSGHTNLRGESGLTERLPSTGWIDSPLSSTAAFRIGSRPF